MIPEVHTSRLSFFGRLTDDLTRRMLTPAEMVVAVDEDPRPPQYKADGHFAFADLAPSATDYHFQLGGPGYQTRSVAKALPSTAPVQVTYDGEDEFYLNLTASPNPQHRITFETMPFVPSVGAGAVVIGEGGFTSTLAEPLEGLNVSTAVLAASAGLASGQVLRVRRGPSLRMRRAAFTTFPRDVTVLVVHVVENLPDEPALAGALVTVAGVNGSGPTPVTAGSLTLQRFQLAGLSRLILDDGGRLATTDARGDAVIVLPGEKAVTALTLSVARAQFVTATPTVPVTVKTRNVQKVPLTHV